MRDVTREDKPSHIVSQQHLEEASLAGNFVVYAKDAAGKWNGVVIPIEEARTHEQAALKRAALTLPSLTHTMTMLVSGPVDGRGMQLREVVVQATQFTILEPDAIGGPTHL
jgi:hypothetical protein